VKQSLSGNINSAEQNSKIHTEEDFERNRSKEQFQEVLNIYSIMVCNFFMFPFCNIAHVYIKKKFRDDIFRRSSDNIVKSYSIYSECLSTLFSTTRL